MSPCDCRDQGIEIACEACSIEARIGTEEVPHPVDRRLHTCVPAAPSEQERALASARLLRSGPAKFQVFDVRQHEEHTERCERVAAEIGNALQPIAVLLAEIDGCRSSTLRDACASVDRLARLASALRAREGM